MNLDPCLPKIPTIYQGEDKVLDVKLTSSVTCDPLDLTSATEILAILPNEGGSTYFEARLTTGGITIVSAPGGHFQIIISSSNSALLALSSLGSFTDIEVHVIIGGKTTIIILPGAVQILARRYPGAAQ